MRRELFKLLTSLSHGLIVLFFFGVVGTLLRLGPLRDDPLPTLGRSIILTIACLVLALLVQWVAFLISPADFEDHNMAQRGRMRE
jgi:Kef-type K+ transport system membrane component KefB